MRVMGKAGLRAHSLLMAEPAVSPRLFYADDKRKRKKTIISFLKLITLRDTSIYGILTIVLLETGVSFVIVKSVHSTNCLIIEI